LDGLDRPKTANGWSRPHENAETIEKQDGRALLEYLAIAGSGFPGVQREAKLRLAELKNGRS
jgi:hypothetical protein